MKEIRDLIDTGLTVCGVGKYATGTANISRPSVGEVRSRGRTNNWRKDDERARNNLQSLVASQLCPKRTQEQMHYSGKDNSDDSVCDNEVEESDDAKCSNEEEKDNEAHDSEEAEGSNGHDSEMEEGNSEHDNEEEEGNDKHDNDSGRDDDTESEEENESGAMECSGYDKYSTIVYSGSKREYMRAYYSKMLRQDRATEEIAHLHQGIHELLQELDMIQSQCFNAEVLSMAKKHLITAVSTVKASYLYPKQFGTLTIPIRKRPAPNAKQI